MMTTEQAAGLGYIWAWPERYIYLVMGRPGRLVHGWDGATEIWQ